MWVQYGGRSAFGRGSYGASEAAMGAASRYFCVIA
jgi:hypothetical protein